VEAMKKVDVVISTVGGAQILDQMNIIKAIKEVGTIKVSCREPPNFGTIGYKLF